MPMPVRTPNRAAVRARNEFSADFRRSARGNLWRRWGDDLIVSVFSRERNYKLRYAWCIAGPDDDRRFSPCDYAGEGDALDALADALGIGG